MPGGGGQREKRSHTSLAMLEFPEPVVSIIAQGLGFVMMSLTEQRSNKATNFS